MLGDLDSNQDKQIQSLLSYHWTIPENDLRFEISDFRFDWFRHIIISNCDGEGAIS